MRRLLVALIVGAFLASPLCRSIAFASQTHVLRWSDSLDVETLNPLLATSANIAWLGQLTMGHFTRYDVHDELVPELIAEIPSPTNDGISRDGRTIVYHLRHDVKWSDGVPFDADDVVFTVGAIQNRANNISSRATWDHVVSVKAPDKYTVVFRLTAPFAPFASSFFSSDSNSCVLPKHILGSLKTINEAPYNALPVGIGPFRYTAFRRGDAVEMEPNPYYFRGKPKLSKIIYKIITAENTLLTQLQTGELDLWSTVNGAFADRVRTLPGIRAVSAPSPFISGIYFNTTLPVLGDPAVRRALRLATDRRFLLDTVAHRVGTLAESVVPKVTADFDPGITRVPYDPAAAARALEAAGWKRGPDGKRSKGGVALTVDIAIPSDYAPSSQTAELLRANWGAVGVDVEVKSYAAGTYFAPASAGGILMSGKFGAALLSLPNNVIADMEQTYGCSYAPPNGFNVTRYCNRDVNADIEAYVRSYDSKRRATLARRFQRAIDADAPGIVIYERDFVYASTTKLTGFTPNAFGPYDNFMNVDVTP